MPNRLAKQYWLMKSEPDTFSIDDLSTLPHQTEHWDGVRNYQARNMMRDQMQVGDLAFFYHSNCNPPGIVGIVEIVKAGYPDYTAFDSHSKYFDPKSTPSNPRWFMVDVKFKRKFKQLISLEQLKQHSALYDMRLLQKGNRLSVMPVTSDEWHYILQLASCK
ncbi:MAG: EVE domain-containing protein [Gammaproteobacteria bacterium]